MQHDSHKAFSLTELLVVIGIAIILAGIAIPAVVAMTKNNSQKQAINLITAYLSAARTKALAEGRMVGVVFFEDSADTNRTAMQMCIEAADPSTGLMLTRTTKNGVVFTAFQNVDNSVAYLPNGIGVATLTASPDQFADMAENGSSGATTRVVLFDSQGQLALRNGLCCVDWSSTATYAAGDIVSNGSISSPANFISLQAGNRGNALTATAWWRPIKWNLLAVMIPYENYDPQDPNKNDTQNKSSSAPGVFVFDRTEFLAATTGRDAATRAAWLKDHSDVLAVNATTGALLR